MSIDFFEKFEEHSIIKSTIVEKYFGAWSRIMKAKASRLEKPALGYIDLYAGAGEDKGGTESTPIKVIKKCVSDPKLCEYMRFFLNDADPEYCNRLQQAIDSLEGVDNLYNHPNVKNMIVNESMAKKFERIRLIPCFSFIDPFGYKGLTKQLIDALVKDWGCDCIFFFNYNRINAGITNYKVFDLINSLFGIELAEKLRKNVAQFSPSDRENYIIDELSQLFMSQNKFVLPFRFQSLKRNSTSHYLIFVSKHVLGYTIMKEIMAKESSDIVDGVASFSYIPTQNQQLSLLYSLSSPLADLEGMLLKRFKGKKFSVKHIFELSHVNTPYILKNYKEVLVKLELENKITAKPPHTERPYRKGVPTMADKTLISFP